MNGARLDNPLSGQSLTAAMLPQEGHGRSPLVGYRVRLERAMILSLDGRIYDLPQGVHVTLRPAQDVSGIEHVPGEVITLSGVPGRDHATITAVIRGYRDYHTRIWLDASGVVQRASINNLPAMRA